MSLNFLIYRKKPLGQGFSERGDLNEIPFPPLPNPRTCQEPGPVVRVSQGLGLWGPLSAPLAKEVVLSSVSLEKGTEPVNEDVQS